MIVIRLQEVARARGVTSSYRLRLLTHVAPTQAARWWKHDFTRITLDHLNLLCAALDCTPNDILEFTPDKPKPGERD